MKKLIFLDFETTGLIEDDKPMPLVIQAAVKIVDGDKTKEITELYGNNNERLNVAVRTETHIQEQDIKDKPLFENSDLLKNLIKTQNSFIFIAHNGIGFDFKVIEHFGFKPKFIIDTLKIAQYLIDNEEDYEHLAKSFKLAHLRFFLQDKGLLSKKYIKKKLRFHQADYDVETLEEVFYGLTKLYKEKFPNKTDKEILTDFINISLKPLLLTFINFGKENGKRFSELDEGYLKWLKKNIGDSRGIDFSYTVDYYLNNLSTPTGNAISQSNVQTNKISTPSIDIPQMPEPELIKEDAFVFNK